MDWQGKGHKKALQHYQKGFLSDPGEIRTLDPMIKSHLLYQLSYGVGAINSGLQIWIFILESASRESPKSRERTFTAYPGLFFRTY